jgi:hypothetical protein
MKLKKSLKYEKKILAKLGEFLKPGLISQTYNP